MRLALGTVQFGLNYGVANKSGQVLLGNAQDILSVAEKHGINTLDTAAAYGDSEEVIGLANTDKFEIISKIPPFPHERGDLEGWIVGVVLSSLRKLKKSAIKGLLFHRPLELLEEGGARAYEAVQSLRNQGLVEKVGVSISDPSELGPLLSRFEFDVVQCPFNIFDQRLANTGWLDGLCKQGVEVHSRSTFLQGLLLMEPNARPDYFKKWQSEFNKYDEWLSGSDVSALAVCLNFALNFDGIAKVIIGVDSASQLVEIVGEIQPVNLDGLSSLAVTDDRLINPASWVL